MNESNNQPIKNLLRIATFDIDGILGTPEQEQFADDDTSVATYERFASQLEAIQAQGAIDRVVLNIRSTGGCVADALLIYDAVRELGVEVVTRCYGYVASAATIIAQAASKGCREISANSLYLIHCCESSVEGNSHSLSATKELLDKSDERLAEIYALASGRSVEEYRELMNRNEGRGIWMSPSECVAAGLADRIIAAAPITDSASGSVERLGLTPLPSSGGLRKRLAVAWNKMLTTVGIVPEAKSVSAADGEQSSVAEQPLRKSAPPVPPSKLHTARKTMTKECEDPAPNGTHSLSPNQSAYAADALALRARSQSVGAE